MDNQADAPGVDGMVVPPGGGRAFRFGPNRLTVKVGPEAKGQFGVIESVIPPSGGPALHRHQRYDEAFYVLEGPIEYRVGERWVTATAGTFVFAPAGSAHGFRNGGASDARHLVIAAPVEALDMIEAASSVAPDQIVQTFARYDTELVDAGTASAATELSGTCPCAR